MHSVHGVVHHIRVCHGLAPRLHAVEEITHMVHGPLRPGGEATAGNRATWLGTLPDFTEEAGGYKLAGVFYGSPAAAAGLQKGDVLVRLGGREVTDLATFTGALRAHGPGSLVEIELLRGERRLRFTVVLGNRADRR